MTVIAFTLAVSLIFGQASRYSANAESKLNSSTKLDASAAGVAQSTGVDMQRTNI